MDSEQYIVGYLQSFGEAFPVLDFSKNPIAASFFALVALVLLLNIAKWLLIALHHVTKDKDKEQ